MVPRREALRDCAGPFRSLRDYLAALDRAGLLLRPGEFDQDDFESTAFAYRLVERAGYITTPAFLFDRVRIDGDWIDGPVVGGAYGHWVGEALCFGITDHVAAHEAYAATLEKVAGLAGPDGFPEIAPREVSAAEAPVKAWRRSGGDVDLTRLPFLKTNPADGGRYINSGVLLLQDPELGPKISVYRCQLQGPRRVSINPEPGQSGWRFLKALQERGEDGVDAALVLGADPVTYGVAASTIARPGQAELAVAGGLLGEAVRVVCAEDSALSVPADAEMIIEGRIPLDSMIPEGPFAEFYGVMGAAKTENFYLDVTSVTHRDAPVFLNSYSGIIRNAIGVTREAHLLVKYRDRIPGLRAIHVPQQAAGVHVVSIDKRTPGQGLEAGRTYIDNEMLPKVVVVVDAEISPYLLDEVWQTLGARWQPHPASALIEKTRGLPLDPSLPRPMESSKIVIDATPQLPGEGGPPALARNSKRLFLEARPRGLRDIDARLDALGVSTAPPLRR